MAKKIDVSKKRILELRFEEGALLIVKRGPKFGTDDWGNWIDGALGNKRTGRVGVVDVRSDVFSGGEKGRGDGGEIRLFLHHEASWDQIASALETLYTEWKNTGIIPRLASFPWNDAFEEARSKALEEAAMRSMSPPPSRQSPMKVLPTYKERVVKIRAEFNRLEVEIGRGMKRKEALKLLRKVVFPYEV
jgi:hypothetical protein